MYTDEHHDTDGKMTLIIGKQGSKLWAVTFPKKPLECKEVHTYFNQALQFKLPTEEDELLCVSFTLVLLPGDIYFQPPGTVHAVYTPEASFIHSGLYLTNLDHTPKQVYEGLVQIMLSLPMNPDKHKPMKPFKDSLQKARDQAFTLVKKCPWAHEAIEYTLRVASFLGWTTKKDLLSYLEQTDGALSDPGEKISIAPILRQILSEQEAAQKAEDEAAIQAVLEVEKAAEKAMEKKVAKKGKIKN
ncbi:hypothetical protein EDD18DRAFT_1100628 [Armillaria luteobubalina]|uniref:JmjC domain-containing protein n=1 Tax=Armillaria luteobubalina TaxID=153913 RepID=A0AA39UT70_9AGAR|nr:hypothetical protein EDD18DRAFT_1100628 [Armillaria luteobubalina]